MSGVPRRLVSLSGLLSIAVPAAVAAHCAGYELAALGQRWLGPLGGSDPHAGHASHLADAHAGHLPLIPLTTGALLLGAVVVLAALASGRRAAGIGAPALGRLLAAQLVVVGAIEVAGVVAGMTPSVPAVVFAVALQLPVAVAVVQLAHSTRRLLGRLLRAGLRTVRRDAAPSFAPSSVGVRVQPIWFLRPPGRGPPLGSAPTLPAASLPTF